MNPKISREIHRKIELTFDPYNLIMRCSASKKPKKIESRSLVCSAIHQVLSSQKKLPKSLVLFGNVDDPQDDRRDLFQHLEQKFSFLTSSLFYAYNSASLLTCLDLVKEPTLLIVYSDSGHPDMTRPSPPLLKALSQAKKTSLTNFLSSCIKDDKAAINDIFLNRPMVIQKSKGKAPVWQSLSSPHQMPLSESQRRGARKANSEDFPSLPQSFGLACTVATPSAAATNETRASSIDYLSFIDRFRGLSLQSFPNIAQTCSCFIKSKLDNNHSCNLRISISSSFPVLVAGLGLALQNCFPESFNLNFYVDDLQFGPSQNLSLLTFLSKNKKDDVGFHIDLNLYPRVTCISKG